MSSLITQHSLMECPNEIVHHVFSFLKETEEKDLKSVAQTCKRLNSLCYTDRYPLAKIRLEKFFPGYIELKPKEISHARYYEQLQTISGIAYAIKKEWKENQTHFDLSKIFMENIINWDLRKLSKLDGVAAYAAGTGYFFLLFNSGAYFFGENYQEEGNFELIKTMQMPAYYSATAGFSYFFVKATVNVFPQRTVTVLNHMGKYIPLGKVISTGNKAFWSLASGAQFGIDLLSRKFKKI